MENLNRQDFDERLNQFVKEEKERLDTKPTGFFGNWAFFAKMKKQFERKFKTKE